MKYIDAGKLIATLERQNVDKKVIQPLIRIIDSLQQEQQEEPDRSLEKAAEEKYPVYWKSYPKDGIVRSESSYDTNKQCRDAFIAGAEWQKNQMLKNAVEGYVNYYEDSGGILMAEAQVGCPYHNGDKVRIVVLKEEE